MTQEPKLFNVWWALAIASAFVSLVAVVLEAVGILHDLGIVMGFAGLALTVLFGMTAATRFSAEALRYSLRGVQSTLEEIRGILDSRLP